MGDRRKVGIRGLKSGASQLVDEVRERGSEYVVTKYGRPVAVLRPWRAEDAEEERRDAVEGVMARLGNTAGKVALAAGRRSARVAVDRQRR